MLQPRMGTLIYTCWHASLLYYYFYYPTHTPQHFSYSHSGRKRGLLQLPMLPQAPLLHSHLAEWKWSIRKNVFQSWIEDSTAASGKIPSKSVLDPNWRKGAKIWMFMVLHFLLKKCHFFHSNLFVGEHLQKYFYSHPFRNYFNMIEFLLKLYSTSNNLHFCHLVKFLQSYLLSMYKSVDVKAIFFQFC